MGLDKCIMTRLHHYNIIDSIFHCPKDPLCPAYSSSLNRPPVSPVAQMVKNSPAMPETWVQSLGWDGPLEKGMATHSSILAWRIPWTEEPGGLQSLGSQRVGHGWATNTFTLNPPPPLAIPVPFCVHSSVETVTYFGNIISWIWKTGFFLPPDNTSQRCSLSLT